MDGINYTSLDFENYSRKDFPTGELYDYDKFTIRPWDTINLQEEINGYWDVMN